MIPRRIMKSFPVLTFLVVAAFALCVVGCKKAAKADATVPLQQSFETAAPEIKEAIATVNANLKAKDYVAATKALAPVVTQHALTDPQRQAVGVALKEISQAIAANPALDSKEMYELRAKMFQAFHSGPRS
jgi:hypothetical protein